MSPARNISFEISWACPKHSQKLRLDLEEFGFGSRSFLAPGACVPQTPKLKPLVLSKVRSSSERHLCPFELNALGLLHRNLCQFSLAVNIFYALKYPGTLSGHWHLGRRGVERVESLYNFKTPIRFSTWGLFCQPEEFPSFLRPPARFLHDVHHGRSRPEGAVFLSRCHPA